MKKAIIIMLVLSLAVCFSACGGKDDVISYTGDFPEDSSTTTTSPSNAPIDLNSTSSTTAPTTESNTATTVLIPLTTVPGGTVPTVVTTGNTTEFSTVDYTPLDISTTKPPVHTTYVNPPQYYVPPQSTQGGNNSTTKKEEVETTRKTSYVSVDPGDTSTSVDTETNTIVITVPADDFGKKMKKSSGNTDMQIYNKYTDNMEHLKASYTVSENLDADKCIVITVEPNSDISFESGDEVYVKIPRGALVSTINVVNNEFQSLTGYVD